MIDNTIRTFLQQPLIARMSTIDEEGYPHTVPVWFALDGDEIVVISVRNTRKVSQIMTNPKGAISIGGDTGDGAGYLLKGDFRVEDDPGHLWMKRLINRYEEGEQAERDAREWAELDIILLRLTPRKVIKVN